MTGPAPSGFRAVVVVAGLAGTGVPDLALVVNDGPLDHAAGVFTAHSDLSATVLWSRQVLTTGRLRAVVLNSGGANAGTGPEAFQTTHATAERTAHALGLGAVEVAVCCTGPTGDRLPREAVLAGVDEAVRALPDTQRSATDAATSASSAAAGPLRAMHRDRAGWRIGGLRGGAEPNAPAAVLCTDAVLDPAELDRALRAAVGATLRADLDRSPQGTVLLLTSGSSGVRAPADVMTAALTEVCAGLLDQSGAHVEENGGYPS